VVTGGTFKRSYDGVTYTHPNNPATVSDFRMDTYEITVGRFRAFVNAGYGTRANPPAAGSGANPKLVGSGWQVMWNDKLTANTNELTAALKCNKDSQTWTDNPGPNENRPINCITWYEAFAFCIWDGGRLPTEAEWNYAAAGGNEQRAYPWSQPPSSTTIDCSYANYSPNWPTSCHGGTNDVGSESPTGDGKWGQSDLAGNVWEWVLDGYADYPNPCNDCANLSNLSDASHRVIRGGSYFLEPKYLLVSFRLNYDPRSRDHYVGARCVRSP
jgi:formylglycine-generating enzyme required for sulfatase activity